MKILGIETSCDETAAAVVEDGRRTLSSVVASQIDVHHPYGGVVPELASRKHIESIVAVVESALADAGMARREIDGIAVTRGPGLVGALLVGFSFAKAMAYGLQIPWVGVDHLAGHLNSVFLSKPAPPFPFSALLVSGGHTNIYHVASYTRARCLGQTLDDAAGEAFDKVAKMLELGYPGGVVIARLARGGDSTRIHFPRAYLDKDAFKFSFSGVKTAVKRYIETHADYRSHVADICAGFEEAVVDVLSYKLLRAASVCHCADIAVVGGVAANQRLRDRIRSEAAERNINVYVPEMRLCGDNAAMIAATGYHYLADPDGPRGRLDDDVYSRAVYF
ncbi:MAG: tRNA (adenosine(37)-N6)-threonylcarbamoyltransferase complex transferase subunit TsaD [Thermodesulfobacteriota bacterium]